MTDNAPVKFSLEEIVFEIDRLLVENKEAPRRPGFFHILPSGRAAAIRRLTDQIDYRQVETLMWQFQAGDDLAGIVLVLKYHPIALGSLRRLDTNTRVATPAERRKKRGFSLEDFKTMGIDQDDLNQEAELLLLKLLREYRLRKGSVFPGLWLKKYFPARFATYVRDKLTYIEKGRRKSKVSSVDPDASPDAEPVMPDIAGSEPVRDFGDYLRKAGRTRKCLAGHIRHYLGPSIRPTTPVEELIGAALKHGWTFRAEVWTREAPLPGPDEAAPEGGTIPIYIPRDDYLDEFLRTKDAYRHLPALQRGTLGTRQIAVYQAAYGPERTTDKQLAQRLGVTRATVQKARARAVELVLREAVETFIDDILEATKDS